MANYAIEGKLGGGKTKFAVWRAQAALLDGRRVASNVDIDIPAISPRKRVTYIRLPDKPTALDLAACGHGNPASYDEDRNGVMLLDELGTWLNSRSFQDKGRAELLDWLIHARKHGWDVYFIVQNAVMIDKQVREALITYQCKCMQLSKVKIPLIGGILGQLNPKLGYLPRMHSVAARFQDSPLIVAERWLYRGDDLHACYDTRQVFRSDYPHGAHSVLPPWDWQPSKGWVQRLREALASARKPQRDKPPLKPKARLAELLAALPPDRRVAAAKMFIAAGRL